MHQKKFHVESFKKIWSKAANVNRYVSINAIVQTIAIYTWEYM
jgi:hypothetical protein